MAQITDIVEHNNSQNEFIKEANNFDTNQVEKKTKTKFQQEYEEAYTLEEVEKMLYKHIEDKWKK